MKKTSTLLAGIFLLPMFGTGSLSSEVLSEPNGDFKAFMRLVLKSPEGFGFANKEDAEGASLGHVYEIWDIDDWNNTKRAGHSEATEVPASEGAFGKIYEVLGRDGEIRCSFFYSRDSSGEFIPVSLSARYTGMLKQIAEHPDKIHLVIIDDVKSKRFSDRRSPDFIMDFADSVGAKPEIPVGILPSGDSR